MLGYFSIIGLLRVHCLLGDYTLALKMMDNIELNKKALFSRVIPCHVTTYYYVGFSYMMMRRYADAIKAFSTVLTFIQRTKQYHTRSYQFDQVSIYRYQPDCTWSYRSVMLTALPIIDCQEVRSNVCLVGHVHCSLPHSSGWEHSQPSPWKVWWSIVQDAKGVCDVKKDSECILESRHLPYNRFIARTAWMSLRICSNMHAPSSYLPMAPILKTPHLFHRSL